MASWHVYMVRCADHSLYTGCTNDLLRRLEAHNAGRGARYTRARRPVHLVWSSRAKDRSAAQSLESKLKSLTRAQKLALMAKANRPSAGRSRR